MHRRSWQDVEVWGRCRYHLHAAALCTGYLVISNTAGADSRCCREGNEGAPGDNETPGRHGGQSGCSSGRWGIASRENCERYVWLGRRRWGSTNSVIRAERFS